MRLGARLRGEDTGGNSYLASVSDLVSALIFVFIIMLAVFAYRLAEVTEDWTSTYETRGRILEDIAVRLGEAGIRVEVLADQGVLRLSDNAINFPSGDEIPVAEHHANVGFLARAIAEVAPCYARSEDAALASPISPDPTGPGRPGPLSRPGRRFQLSLSRPSRSPGHTADRRAHRRRSSGRRQPLPRQLGTLVHASGECSPDDRGVRTAHRRAPQLSRGTRFSARAAMARRVPPPGIRSEPTTIAALTCASCWSPPKSSAPVPERPWKGSGSGTARGTHEGSRDLPAEMLGRMVHDHQLTKPLKVADNPPREFSAEPCAEGRRERSEAARRSEDRTPFSRESRRSVLASSR